MDPALSSSSAAAYVRLEKRAAIFSSVLGKDKAEPVIAELRAQGGDSAAAITLLDGKLPNDDLRKIKLVNSLADMSGDDGGMVSAMIRKTSPTATLRDVALAVGLKDLAASADPTKHQVVTGTHNTDGLANSLGLQLDNGVSEHSLSRALAFRQKLFRAEPTAVLQRMVMDNEVPFADKDVGKGVITFFANQPTFNIRHHSILSALQEPDSFKTIPKKHQAAVVTSLKSLQAVQALATTPEAIPILMRAGFQSAFHVSSIPEKAFARAFDNSLGRETAQLIHQHAIRSRARNDNALTTMLQTVRGAGIAAIDGKQTLNSRKDVLSKKLTKAITRHSKSHRSPVPVVDLEALFGSLDYCECSDCTSINSPAAYLVEILQFLRNNNLNWDVSHWPNSGQLGIQGTPLAVLFARRPDLGNLQLTCENTNTILPYIDLANEVMESFVVHQDEYVADKHDPKQSDIDVFNVTVETSSELLSEPQHTNYTAYCILKDAVFPISSAPYHQPIDETRIFLQFMGTSRYELMSTFQPGYQPQAANSASDDQALKIQHQVTLNRAATAEYWKLIHTDYIAITKESFWSKAFWEIKKKTTFTDAEYQKSIGRKYPWAYWGYHTKAEMENNDNVARTGLMYVKAQFLPRSGLLYADLVDLVKTHYVNPNYPTGRELLILENLRFSYRFLQTLVDTNAKTPRKRYAKLVAFLMNWQPWAKNRGVSDIGDSLCLSKKEICCFVHCWFEILGQLIVLETGDGPRLPIEGTLFVEDRRDSTTVENPNGTTQSLAQNENNNLRSELSSGNQIKNIGSLNRDGQIKDNKGRLIGYVGYDSTVYDSDDKLFTDNYPATSLIYIVHTSTPSNTSIRLNAPDPPAVVDDLAGGSAVAQQRILAYLTTGSILAKWNDRFEGHPDEEDFVRVEWLPVVETCDINKVQLLHLDGSQLSPNDYDRIQAFLRLWRKLGWTIDQTDQALAGISMPKIPTEPPIDDPEENMDSISDFSQVIDPTRCRTCSHDKDSCTCDNKSDCSDAGSGDENDCDCAEPVLPEQITPKFLEQLISVQRILDLTGIDLVQILTIWTDISIVGNPSLYSTTFLPHSIQGIDSVFQADANGHYLSTPLKISDHMPVLLAALRTTADGIAAIIAFTGMPDHLNLKNISVLYRFCLLGRILRVKLSILPDIIALFGDPFADAESTLKFLQLWQQVQDKGFSFAQLNYLILNKNDPIKPLGPSMVTVLKAAKEIFDGLNSIDTDNPQLLDADKDKATADYVNAKASLIFDSATVASILGLLQGTTVYSTNAPSGLGVIVPENLQPKVQYSDVTTTTPPRAMITVIGILTAAEKVEAKSLSTNALWSDTIDRVSKQAEHFFDNSLFGIFTDDAAAKAILLAGDIPPPPAPATTLDPVPLDNSTAGTKRLYFLQQFLPFLKKTLSQRLILDVVSTAASISTVELATILLTNIITVNGGSESGLAALATIQNIPAASQDSWNGYLIPSASDSFTFVAGGFPTQPPPLMIDGQPLSFPHQQDDPNDVWSTNPIVLINGKLYQFSMTGQSIMNLQWKTARSPISNIPSSALLPNYSSSTTYEVFQKAYKVGLVINGLNLSVEEVSYFLASAADFGSVNFDAMTLKAWQRLSDYSTLRDSLPALPGTLLDLFKWASASSDATKLADQISTVTNWKRDDVLKLIIPSHFNLNDPKFFKNETQLLIIQNAVAIAAKIGVDVNLLFNWAEPLSFFWKDSRNIAESIRKTVRSRYDVETWEQIAKPLFDTLRSNQRDALMAYLIVQKPLKEWGVVDANSLFEFFLIDVQMGACLETSRIKQAISTVQLFIQRCLLGLEPEVPNAAIAQDRWKWMYSYRLWEANRKIFLYPENWLDPTLRDDKSIFFKTLESQLLQKDVNSQTVQDAIKEYLFSVDDVSNLHAVGLVMDQDPKVAILHIFARTRRTPYFYYYRQYKTLESNWMPWEPMQVDIISYDQEDSNGAVIENGTYMLPVIWNGRLLVFLPQFSKKTVPVKTSEDTTSIMELGNAPVNAASATNSYWEIKMGLTEYRNGKWTAKQVSSEAVFYTPPPSTTPPSTSPPPPPPPIISQIYPPLPPISQYQFVPKITGTELDTMIVIGVFQNSTSPVGWFQFNGAQLSVLPLSPAQFTLSTGLSTDFLYLTPSTGPEIRSYEDDGGTVSPLSLLATPPAVQYPLPLTPQVQISATVTQPFYHTFIHKLLTRATTAPTVDGIYSYLLNNVPSADKNSAFGLYDNPDSPSSHYHELKTPYALYNWEVGLHVPMLLMNKLLSIQQFDQALAIAHYVFDPFATVTKATEVWQWAPFRDVVPENILENTFAALGPNEIESKGSAVEEWRDNAFEPHVVARSRPVAYMKWFAVQYIQILIAYGDYYFMQNTLESIPLAIQLYVRAAHIYGPPAQQTPKRGTTKVATYNSLLNKWNGFSNAIVEMELAFPFSNQSSLPVGDLSGELVLANIFGFASTTYFCVPNNPQLAAVRDLIDDRLFKIRHCQDINGVVQKLPLFEPPLDPGLLVQAAAAGLSFASILNDLNAPMPNYKFFLLLQKALELCSDLKSMGSQFLSTKEKKDAEALSIIRARQESTMSNLIMELRKQQVIDAEKSLEALVASRKSPVYRLQHFIKLIGEDLAKVPDEATDFTEFAELIEAPITDGGLKLIASEKTEMDKASAANDWNTVIGSVETLAGLLHALPTVDADAQPWGFGATLKWGPTSFAEAASATARGMRCYSDRLSFDSADASRTTNFLRQLQDRVMQANLAGYEIKNIDKQVETQGQKIAIANQEITNQQQSIDNAQETFDFLRNKYTNQELYAWMEDNVKTLYYQTYTLAYQLAKKAENAYCFERALDPADAKFISFGYWDTQHDGLLSGERLYLGLKQLEAAYYENRGYDFEVTKHVSLRQLNPMALFRLRETASCEVDLSEILFDMDFPGHYQRRIKTVSLTIPCIVGPYTSISCTLRMLDNRYRISAIAKDKNDYPMQTSSDDTRFRSANVPISSIAISAAQSDTGLFELNFKDERYIPFEGAGVISKWRLELPDVFRQWDYSTINDVIMSIRYTSKDGGDKLKMAASSTVIDFIKSVEDLSKEQGLFSIFDLRSEFANEWAKAFSPPLNSSGTIDTNGSKTLTLQNLLDRLPAYTKGRPANKIIVTDVFLLLSPLQSWVGKATLSVGDGQDDGPVFSPGDTVGSTSVWQITGESLQISTWGVTLGAGGSGTENLEKGWLVLRYTLE